MWMPCCTRHGHADHILGFDDLRPLTFGKPDRLPLYADDPTADTIERIFDYTFKTPRSLSNQRTRRPAPVEQRTRYLARIIRSVL